MNPPAERNRTQPEWMRQRERGSAFLLRLMRFFSLTCGRRVSRVIVYIAAAYFVLAVPPARRASRQYLARVFGRTARWAEVYRHFLTFGTTIHDRMFLLNDCEHVFDFHWEGTDILCEAYARGEGLFLFGAHLGSFEVMRSFARTKPDMRLSLAMFPDNARQLNSALTAINSRVMQDIIALGQMDSMLLVHQKLKEGCMVGILADRASGADSCQAVTFLGQPMQFPTGPFRMAAMLRQQVLFMAGVYGGNGHYEIRFERMADFAAQPAGSRDAAVQAAVETYVATLERYCRAYPYNWFNFFDFWGGSHDAN